MKKLLLLVLPLLFLSGCSLTGYEKTNQEINSQVENAVMMTWIENKECTLEKLIDVPIIIMDDVVKNCTQKKKNGTFVDGLWWGFPTYIIANGQMLDNFNDDEVVCEISDNNSRFPQGKYTKTNPNYILEYEAIQKVIGKWLVNEINLYPYSVTMYCQNDDTECLSMIDLWWRTDWKNYFVAWFRNDFINEEWFTKKVYVINDKIYSPWSYIIDIGVTVKSSRNFVNIEDNKIIVKRIKNGKVIWDPWTSDEEEIEKLKTSFILETCEIDL